MDRTLATGTGYIGQYPPEVARQYESLDTCPDHLAPVYAPRTVYACAPFGQDRDSIRIRFTLRCSGRSAAISPLVAGIARPRDEQRYRAVLDKLDYQAGHAIVCAMPSAPISTGIGHCRCQRPRRSLSGPREAESMRLDGYTVEDAHPAKMHRGERQPAAIQHRRTALHRIPTEANRVGTTSMFNISTPTPA